MSMDEYIAIVISCCYDAEDEFIKAKLQVGKLPEDWEYIVTNGTDYKENEDLDSFNFALINQCKWTNEKVKNLIDVIKNKNKKIIVWSHQTSIQEKNCDPITESDIEQKGIVFDIFAKFSHTTNSVPENFLNLLKGNINNYNESLKYLITESLKRKNTPHLIALSILCQGYLAAHGETKKLKGWNENLKKLLVKDAEEKTKGKDWWFPAFSEDELKKEFKNTEISNELSACGKESDLPTINGLFKKIQNDQVDVDAVKKAYGDLKQIPERKQ